MEKRKDMIKHYMTKYRTKEGYFVESWLQIDIFGRSYCFSK